MQQSILQHYDVKIIRTITTDNNLANLPDLKPLVDIFGQETIRWISFFQVLENCLLKI